MEDPPREPRWDDVIVTARDEPQAASFRAQLRRRLDQARLPAATRFLVIPDPANARAGTGGATLHALRHRWPVAGPAPGNRTLLIHAGGESRRLPAYSATGKLFAPLPGGREQAVFDRLFTLLTGWLADLPGGLLATSGDVMPGCAPDPSAWRRPGVSGIAVRAPVRTASHHGVYRTRPDGRVDSFLQKPSPQRMRVAGALGPDGRAAVDTGLLFFDEAVLARLLGVARAAVQVPALDLYYHVTRALTGEWAPEPADPPAAHALCQELRGVPFWCSVYEGDLAHMGSTTAFLRSLAGASAGITVNSAIETGSRIGPGSAAVDCRPGVPMEIGRECMVVGAVGLSRRLCLPDRTIAHQVALRLHGGPAAMVAVYGVHDDPRARLWFGQAMEPALADLRLHPDEVWPGVAATQRTLWNAALFAVGSVDDAWACARWLLGQPESWSAARWRERPRMSMADSLLAPVPG